MGGTAVLPSYDWQVFQELNAFQTAKRLLAENRDAIGQLGDVICEHQLHEHVGISLLHRHFGLTNQERVVRRFALEEAVVQPERIDQADDVIPYVWKAETGGAARFYPLEFSAYPERFRGVAQRDAEAVANSPRFLAAMSQKLDDLGLSNLFGIATMNSMYVFTLRADDIVLESPGDGDRVLRLRPVPASAVTEETTETLWGFTPLADAEGETDPAITNGFICLGHCNNHCINHCTNHCINHCVNH